MAQQTDQDTLRKAVYEHHIKQHRQAMAESLAKHGKPAAYFLKVDDAKSVGGQVVSNGRGMFGGPIDAVSPAGRGNIGSMLGSQANEFFQRFSVLADATALVTVMVSLDGQLLTFFTEEKKA